MAKMNIIGQIAAWLLVVAGLNWAFIALFDTNFVTTIFSGFADAIYIAVGISALLFALEKLGVLELGIAQ